MSWVFNSYTRRRINVEQAKSFTCVFNPVICANTRIIQREFIDCVFQHWMYIVFLN
jgi:hypothetical protein